MCGLRVSWEFAYGTQIYKIGGQYGIHVYAYGVKTAPVVIAIFTFRTVALAHMVDATSLTLVVALAHMVG